MSYAGKGKSESTWARRRRKVVQWGIASMSVGLLAAHWLGCEQALKTDQGSREMSR
jgi:hypothetical protein